MKFKAGDRVHVIKHNGRAVDFYATLRELSKNFFLLTNCTDEKFKVICFLFLCLNFIGLLSYSNLFLYCRFPFR